MKSVAAFSARGHIGWRQQQREGFHRFCPYHAFWLTFVHKLDMFIINEQVKRMNEKRTHLLKSTSRKLIVLSAKIDKNATT